MRVFFDASVIIAALLSKTGGSAILLQYIKKGTFIGITSQTVIDEMLEEDKPNKLNKSKSEIEEFVVRSGLVVRERISEEEIVPYKGKVDAEDAHLFAGAKTTRCTHLVSHDKNTFLRRILRSSLYHCVLCLPENFWRK